MGEYCEKRNRDLQGSIRKLLKYSILQKIIHFNLIISKFLVLVWFFLINFNSNSIYAKTKSVLVTEKQRKIAVENAKKIDWVQEIQTNAIRNAEVWMRMSDDELQNLVNGQSVTRDIHTNTNIGCPNCGDGILGFGNYPWEQAGEWKLQCPNCCEIYPKNDFKIYLKFKDKSSDILKYIAKPTEFKDYLLDTIYQTDIGYGMFDSLGNQHNMIAYYNHWYNWRGFIPEVLNSLSYAYTLTNDKKYAEKSLIILLKIAEVYPTLDYENQDSIFKNRSHTGKGIGGLATDKVWENFIVLPIIRAYDRIYDGIPEHFYNRNKKKISKKTIHNIMMDSVFNTIFYAIKNKRIVGNPSMSNLTLSLLYIITKEDNESGKFLNYTLSPEYYNGFSTTYLLTEKLDRFGIGNECGDYGLGWSRRLKSIINLFLDNDVFSKDSILIHFPKIKSLYSAEYNLRVLNNYLPPIGDLYIISSWRKNSLYNTDSDEIYEKNGIESSVKDFRDSFELSSNLMINSYIRSDYGQSVIQKKNTNTDGFGLWIHHGGPKGHSHADNLNIGLIGYNFDLLPDIGYPDYANFDVDNAERWAWTSNTMSHNTLLINDKKSRIGAGGIIEYIYHSDNLQSLQVNSKYAYDSVDLYQRTLFLIEIDSVNSYAVDVFRASGGFSHRLSYHGAAENLLHTLQGMNLQKKGTFAGENIEFRYISDEEKNDYSKANGFSFLRDVEKTNKYITDNFEVNWKCKDVLGRIDSTEDINLKIHSLNNLNEVAFAIGENPKLRGDVLPTFRYMIQSRFGENLKSQFVNLIELYKNNQNNQNISSVERISHKSILNDSTNSTIIKINLKNGFVDYIFSCNIQDSIYTDYLSFNGKSGYIRTLGDTVLKANLVMSKNISFKNFKLNSENISVSGNVKSIDYSNPNDNYIIVDSNIPLDSSIIGYYIHIKNSDRYDNSYEIKGIQGNKISFGDITLIKGFVDMKDYSKGHTYYVNPGDKFVIPLSKDYGIKH